MNVQVRRGVRAGHKKTGALPHRAYRSPGISKAHGPGWAGYDRRDTYFQSPEPGLFQTLYRFVLARNMAMVTVAPDASIAAMNAADDCPVV